MNTVFVVVGLLTSAGAVLTRGVWPRRRVTSVGLVFVVVCGVFGSAASVLYLSGSYLGLGPGGMEHLAFDPLTVWTTVLGLVLLGRWLVARRHVR